jgi:signal transduction histidine kinase
MKTNYDVKKLIKYIKVLPIVVALIFSITTTYLVLHNHFEKHKENIKSLKEDFLLKEKLLIKDEVIRTARQIRYQKNIAEKNLKDDIKKRVTTVYNIINNIYSQNQDKSEEEIKKFIKDAIRTMRFNEGRGYFFIYTLTGDSILFPPASDLEGENMWDLKDSSGDYSIRRLSQIAKEENAGFLTWYWFKPGKDTKLEKEMSKKIGYVKYFKEFDWFVGTGEYLENFEDKIKKNLINEIQQVKYAQNGSIFIDQYNGLTLANMDKSLIGKNRLTFQNNNGRFPIQEMLEISKSGEGYIRYLGDINPLTKKEDEMLSYVLGFDDWQWQIGASAFLSQGDSLLIKKEIELKKQLYTSITSTLISSIILTLLLIFIMLRLLTIIEKEFTKYERSLRNHIKESNKKDKLLFEQSKLASMGEMIGNIAHQWRQPLSVISTASTGMKMQKKHDCLSDDVFYTSCDAINNNAQYLSDTIDDFRNFIKGSHTKEIFNISKAIASFLHLVDGSLKSHDIHIDLNLDDEITIYGYENELVQCFMNIYNNAKDALIERKKEDRKFFVKTYTEKQHVILEIGDNAGGIKNDIISKIFEPYFTTKHKSQGTGLGLHMTYNLIVDGMSGTIEVQNDKENDGALFTIKLPLK